MKPFLFILFFLSSSSYAESELSKPIKPIGASQARMWNWLLVNEKTGEVREKPIIGAAKCHFDQDQILSQLGLPDSSLFYSGNVISEARAKNVKKFNLELEADNHACEVKYIGRNFIGSLSSLSPLGSVSENSRKAIREISDKIVMVYGSDNTYVDQGRGDTLDANNLIAAEMANKCVSLLKRSSFKFTNLITREVLLSSLKLVPANVQELTKRDSQEKIDDNIEINKAVTITGKSNVLLQGYSFSQIPLNYSVEDRERIYQFFLSTGKCELGKRWGGNNGAQALPLPNKCNKKYKDLTKKIASLEGGPRKFLNQVFGSIGCGIGRRLEGGGILQSGGLLAGSISCGLTEVVNGYGCAGALTIMKNVALTTAGAFLGGSIPNGSALGDCAYNGGGVDDRQRPVDRINSNSGKSFLCGVAAEGARDSIRQAFLKGKVNLVESVRNGAINSLLYRGPIVADYSETRADFLGLNGVDAVSNSEYLSGGFRGYLNASERAEKCVERVYDELTTTFNKIDAPKVDPSQITK